MASLWNIMEHPVSAILLIAGSLNVVAGYHVVESTMTWADASAYCSDTYGSTLATFSTDAEASELRTMMDASSKGHFWFGLNDLASEGTWVFESGYDCGGNCDSIEEWNSGEPNDSGSGEDCALFWPSGTTFKINDGQCSYDGLAFICNDDADTTMTVASVAVVAAENVCFSATEYVTDYIFDAPTSGNLVGVELEHLSGGVSCDYRIYEDTNWGCGNNWIYTNVLRHSADGSQSTIFPTSTTDDITSIGSPSCSNGNGCTAYAQFANYDQNSASLVFMDEANPITVTTDDSFSVQFQEGCCGQSTGDNSGTSCAKVYFYYVGDSTTATTLSPSVVPSSAPSPAPSTVNPTAIPTVSPSVEPTTDPTAVPTVEPTIMPTRCDIDAIYGVNWHDMLNEDEEDTALLKGYSVDFDASTLSLTFSATVEYVGRSADGNFKDDYDLGTTYFIGFESFAAIDDGLEAAGTCANRVGADYDDLDFANYFNFTVDPADLAAASAEERTAYPASDWTLTAKNCSMVEYELTLSWTEMMACSNDAGNGLIDVTETNDTVTLSGTFYVELVSPYSMDSEGYYRTFPLIQQDFAIVLNREVNALASTGVQLFIPTVMAYGRDDDGNYELTILVQSADYVTLGMDNAVTLIGGPHDVSDIQTVSDCLVASSFTCGQIFTATIPAECSADDNTVDLSGKYQFSFTPQCQTDDEDACNVFLSTLDESQKVVLDVDASFTDNCDVQLFNVTFGADLTFYEDDAFTVPADSEPYVIGQDTIYGKVLVDIPDNGDGEMYDFVEVSIENVYVCTAVDTADLSLDASSGLGGCLSEHIDADGPYVVFGTGAETKYQGVTYAATGNEATFSFLTFDTPRTTISVHVQLLLTLTTQSGQRRRMLLGIESDEGSAFQSFIGTASVQEGETTAEPVGTDGAAKLSGGFIAAMLAFTAYILG